MTGPVLHPIVAEGLVRERQAELLRAAEVARLRRSARRLPAGPSPLRRRVGWALVEIGLRLAIGRTAARVTG
ncbi:hypothetical protein LWC35_04880 [Pseudonocardia kujensis]|uniref:hypothetical protein n=1 Tax=Pseudonocardia kujensis TaxID=1128675 RepID=UPI001E577272|nr:hypothetical protein [Pseudonocardia kujensis]MCE0762248.1 hypothetical protein [Pseudonocardia kujensis]